MLLADGSELSSAEDEPQADACLQTGNHSAHLICHIAKVTSLQTGARMRLFSVQELLYADVDMGLTDK